MSKWELPNEIRARILAAGDWWMDSLIANDEAERCESPIELAFFVVFGYVALLSGLTISVECQALIDNYRVDFLIERKGRRCVVECDGRDFHHASWQQIERDRERDRHLEALGFKVFRFPGTQIHNHPVDCGLMVANWLVAKQAKGVAA